jgi:hypothetical protein
MICRIVFRCIIPALTSPVQILFQAASDLVRLFCRHGHHFSSDAALVRSGSSSPVYASLLKVELGGLFTKVFQLLLQCQNGALIKYNYFSVVCFGCHSVMVANVAPSCQSFYCQDGFNRYLRKYSHGIVWKIVQ